MAVGDEFKTLNYPKHMLWMKDASRTAETRQKRKSRTTTTVTSNTKDTIDRIEGLSATKAPISRTKAPISRTKPPISSTKRTINKTKNTKNNEKRAEHSRSKKKRVVRKNKNGKIVESGVKNVTKPKFVDKAVGRSETEDDRTRKESLVMMAQRLDESNIPSFETRCGLFDEVKDEHDVTNHHTNVGGRSKYKRKNSLQFYKDGYEPGQSVLLYNSSDNTVTEDYGLHMPIDESITNLTITEEVNPLSTDNEVHQMQHIKETNPIPKNIRINPIPTTIGVSSNITAPKRRNFGFHLSLNESTMSFLGTSSMGFLEMSSGLVINKTKPNYDFHISLDDVDDLSKSGAYIKNQIFNENNEWATATTSPGRLEKLADTAQVNVTVTPAYNNGTTQPALPMESLPPKDDNILDVSRGSTRLSFLYNKYTGFICKHCFQTNCNHMEKISPLATPQREVYESSQDKSVEQTQEDSDKDSEESDDRDVNTLLENLSERLNKSKDDVIYMSDLKKLIKLKKVFYEDENGNMVAYNEFILDLDNVPLDSDITLLDQTENELLNLSIEPVSEKENEQKDEIHNLENDLELGESMLRITPIIQENKREIPIIRKQHSDSESIKSAKEALFYDSDYDDASYLNACALSKSHTSFEKYDVIGDVLYTNVEGDMENVGTDGLPSTPPLTSSSPRGQKEDNGSNTLKISKRSHLRSKSGLETVFEAEVAHHRTPNPTSNDAEDKELENLLSFADDILDKSSECSVDNERHDKSSECSTNFNGNVEIKQVQTINSTDDHQNQEMEDEYNNEKYYVNLSELQNLREESPPVHNNTESNNDTSTPSPNFAYIKHIPDKNSYPGLDEEDKMQLWLQDVRKETLNEECFSSDTDNLQPEDEEVRNINKQKHGLTTNQQKNNSLPNNEPSSNNTGNQTSDTNNTSEVGKTPPDVNLSYKHIDLLVLDNNDENASIAEVSTLADNTARTDDSGVDSRITENSQITPFAIDDIIQEQDEVDGTSNHQRPISYSSEAIRNMISPSEHQESQRSIIESNSENYEDYLLAHSDYLKRQINHHTPKPPSTPKKNVKAFKRAYSAKSKDSREEMYMNDLNFVMMQNQHSNYRVGQVRHSSHREPFVSHSLLPFVNQPYDFPSIHQNGNSSDRSCRKQQKEDIVLPYLHNTSLPLLSDYQLQGHMSKQLSKRALKYEHKKQERRQIVHNEKYDDEQYLTMPFLLTSRSDSYLPSSFVFDDKSYMTDVNRYM